MRWSDLILLYINPISFACPRLSINPFGNWTKERESAMSGLHNPSCPILILHTLSISVALADMVFFLVPKKLQIVSGARKVLLCRSKMKFSLAIT
jgi:hypothetical protein